MPLHFPSTIIGFHSCDKEVGLKVLNGQDDLIASNNEWDWLGNGIYFWELNPFRAMEYANENSEGLQFNKISINRPFVLGAIIELGNCLNLLEAQSLLVLSTTYYRLQKIMRETGKQMPENIENNRALDCAVIRYLHQIIKILGEPPLDTIRCAFPEGSEIYPGSAITSRLHVQICVLNPECIQGYFLPRPIELFNPHLKN